MRVQLPQIKFDEAIKIVYYHKYSDFKGRARRSEYWYAYLFQFLISFLLGIIVLTIIIVGVLNKNIEAQHITADDLMSTPSYIFVQILYYLVNAFFLVPNLAVLVRRLHDTGKSGWYAAFQFIPIVGSIIVLVFALEDTQFGDNEYGKDPKFLHDESNSDNNQTKVNPIPQPKKYDINSLQYYQIIDTLEGSHTLYKNDDQYILGVVFDNQKTEYYDFSGIKLQSNENLQRVVNTVRNNPHLYLNRRVVFN